MQKVIQCGLSLVIAVLSAAALADEVRLGDDITAGVQTSTEFEARPFGYRVTWINWDSYVRDSELRLGDRILGVNGERYSRETHNLGYAIGNHAENRYWADRGAKDGDSVTLIVERDGEEITVAGRLMANRFYYNDDGRQTLGLGGPDRLLPEVDENGNRPFEGSWAGWYEDKTGPKPGSWQFLLDGSWERTGFNNQRELEAHQGDQERIDYLALKYPSPFAETMRGDFERVRDYLDGDAVELAEDALDYRTRADELRAEIDGYAERAIAALEAELGDRLETAPSASDLDEQRQAYVGKVVYFDGLGNRNIINDLEQTFMVAGGDRDGYYFLDADQPAMDRAFAALYRYRALVNPQLAERYSVWIEVQDEPRIITFRSSPAIGLLGKLVAIAGGTQEVFVDARPETEQLAVAGEAETEVEQACAIAAGDPPEATVACLVEALKSGDRDSWQSLFAEWRFIASDDDGPPLFDPDYRLLPAHFEDAWQASRRLITGDVYDARIGRVDRARLLHDPAPGDPVPRVESVRILLDHVGLIEGEYRTFSDLNVHRVWRLQRLDGGPWKITEVQRL
jgi:hypothetical protein